MSITITVMKKGDDCQLFADMFPDGPKAKFGYAAAPVVFTRRALFTTDPGEPMLYLPLEEAKKMAREIFEL